MAPIVIRETKAYRRFILLLEFVFTFHGQKIRIDDGHVANGNEGELYTFMYKGVEHVVKVFVDCFVRESWMRTISAFPEFQVGHGIVVDVKSGNRKFSPYGLVMPRAISDLDAKGELSNELLLKALDALKLVRSKRLAHLDVKSQNFLLFRDGCVHACDFSYSRWLGSIREEFAGTPRFAHPDSASINRRYVTGDWDLFAFLGFVADKECPQWILSDADIEPFCGEDGLNELFVSNGVLKSVWDRHLDRIPDPNPPKVIQLMERLLYDHPRGVSIADIEELLGKEIVQRPVSHNLSNYLRELPVMMTDHAFCVSSDNYQKINEKFQLVIDLYRIFRFQMTKMKTFDPSDIYVEVEPDTNIARLRAPVEMSRQMEPNDDDDNNNILQSLCPANIKKKYVSTYPNLDADRVSLLFLSLVIYLGVGVVDHLDELMKGALGGETAMLSVLKAHFDMTRRNAKVLSWSSMMRFSLRCGNKRTGGDMYLTKLFTEPEVMEQVSEGPREMD